jgi:hypothetical protein
MEKLKIAQLIIIEMFFCCKIAISEHLGAQGILLFGTCGSIDFHGDWWDIPPRILGISLWLLMLHTQ